MDLWFWIWLILAAALFISEMMSVTFFILPFAVGATAAMIANLCGLGLIWQWVIFILVSIVSLAACRPLANRLSRGSSAKSGVDRLIGMDAVIIDHPAPLGMRRAKVAGDLWNIALEPGLEHLVNELFVGERVYIMRIDGTRLIVRRYQ